MPNKAAQVTPEAVRHRHTKMIRETNRALKIYLGSEHGGYQPVGDPEDRLRQEYQEEYKSIRAMLEQYLNEEAQFDYPETAPSLATAGEIFAEYLRAKYPELDPMSIKGLANRFMYRWK